MKLGSRCDSGKAELVINLDDQTAATSATQGSIFQTVGRSGRLAFTAGSIILALLFSQMVFAAEFCSGSSAIDEVPFFIGQSYRDILNRDPDVAGQRYWITALEDLNTRNLQIGGPGFLRGKLRMEQQRSNHRRFSWRIRIRLEKRRLHFKRCIRDRALQTSFASCPRRTRHEVTSIRSRLWRNPSERSVGVSFE